MVKSNSTITTNNATTPIRNPSTTKKLTHHLSFLNGSPSQMDAPKNSRGSFGSSSIGGIRRSFMFKSNQTVSPKTRPFYPQRSHSTVSHLPKTQPEILKMKVAEHYCVQRIFPSIFCFPCQFLRNQRMSICKH